MELSQCIDQLEQLSKSSFKHQIANGREGIVSWETEIRLYEFEDDDERYLLSVSIFIEDVGIVEEADNIIIAINQQGQPEEAEVIHALQDSMKAAAVKLEIELRSKNHN